MLAPYLIFLLERIIAVGKLVKNSLGYDSDLFVYQDKEMFNYSIDTILLGNFVSISSSTKNMLEVGTNNGALSIFVSERNKSLMIHAIEIQQEPLEIAKKNVKLNKKEKQIHLEHIDFNDYHKKHAKLQMKKFDSIICNPPFYKIDASIRRNGSDILHNATHEVHLNLEQLIVGSAKIIEQKGYLAIVEPTERLVDIFVLMRKYGFEPKRVQFIHPRENQKSNLVLVEGRYKAGWGTHFLKNLYLHTDDFNEHEYKDEIKKLYKPIKIKENTNE
ncbi:tRNA1(Val) (adenine(37)-N6)-methyltransferase [Candidatus Mycoplasma mahonii]|uniref:tRNA1(Val) (adenine(37)-N6)-methyltransferase n=1 Tax=Candidatus Mycoplasma mahonii TaxID=3004105 RepID=UPI0026F37B08|nr:tRNA1(Val) (adenine(37)-N6)-methyltransferase [Candidatus Mycoplasma mahonii]WKX02559.1 tRNA1(Val) (adenine(37)-N6)-methyltransferase [Candidatus Mycoplasma mahonii]